MHYHENELTIQGCQQVPLGCSLTKSYGPICLVGLMVEQYRILLDSYSHLT